MYVNNARKDNEDPVSLFRAIVGMMNFVINHSKENKEENFGLKIEKYLIQVNKEHKVYQTLLKNHKSNEKNIEQLKERVDEHYKMLMEDKAGIDWGMKRNMVDNPISQPKYPKQEPGSSNRQF